MGLSGGEEEVRWVEKASGYVNLLAGSFTKGDDFSTGNTLPLVGYPWGFNHWALQTNRGDTAWWFGGNDHEYRWIRCTHQPSPWIGDYGYFVLGPQMGSYTDQPTGFFEPRAAELKPHFMGFTTAPDGMKLEFAPTMRGGVLRVRFPGRARLEKRICFGYLDSWRREDGKGVSFAARRNSGGTGPDFGLWGYVESDDHGSIEDHGTGAFCFSYGQTAEQVTVRLATSFIDIQQAKFTFNHEVNGLTLEAAKDKAEKKWDDLLGRVTVGVSKMEAEDSLKLRKFYTCLYRALTFPRRIDEPSEGKDTTTRHWSPYKASMGRTKQVFPGVLVTDNGFWDTFRSVYPMLALYYPDHLKWILKGWINAYREGGWIPKWASPGYRNSMVGTYGDVSLADGLSLGFIESSEDRRDAYDAVRKDCFDTRPPQGGAVGRVGLDHYLRFGYIPDDVGTSDAVSRTLDFAYADFSVARAASALGLAEDAQKLRARSKKALESLYDSETGLMRPKSQDGLFKRQFSAVRWGDGYTEGSAWHHSFPAFDATLLAQLHGGKDKLRQKLDQMLNEPSNFEPGGYRRAIHEMLEFRALAMGQYGHNNQPAHHALLLYALTGDGHTANSRIRQVLDQAYGVDFFAGDEDNGEMGAWFVMAASGLFAVPGTAEVVAVAPYFDHLKVTAPTGVSSYITAHRSTSSNVDVTKLTLNHNVDLSVSQPTLRFDALRSALDAGASIDFYMDRQVVATLPTPSPVMPPHSTPKPTLAPSVSVEEHRGPDFGAGVPLNPRLRKKTNISSLSSSSSSSENNLIFPIAGLIFVTAALSFLAGRVTKVRREASPRKRSASFWRKRNSHVV